MEQYNLFLEWIDTQEKIMRTLVERWANINSGTYNLKGLAAMLKAVKKEFASLDGTMQELSIPNHAKVNSNGDTEDIPLGKALIIKKRPQAQIQVFLGVHLDTAFPADSSFQKATLIDRKTLKGPGVADIKGGIVVMLKALEALERSPFSQEIGWEIFFSPDEEIGSPSSAEHLRKRPHHHDIAILFEPSLPDGSLITKRKGSGIYSIVVRGKPAHVGREFHKGRNAITALAGIISDLETLNDDNTILNVGKVEGGGAVNIVPALSICHFNIRVDDIKTMKSISKKIENLITSFNKKDNGLQAELHGSFHRPPKPFDDATKKLFHSVNACAEELGMTLQWQSSGGVCDGNILAAEGLSTIDSLGACGGGIHTHDEYILLPSLKERARLVALFLMKLASRKIKLPKERVHD